MLGQASVIVQRFLNKSDYSLDVSIVSSCVWFQILAVKFLPIWCYSNNRGIYISLSCMMPLPGSSHLSSSWRKLAGCSSWNEVVIGPSENGFDGSVKSAYYQPMT